MKRLFQGSIVIRILAIFLAVAIAWSLRMRAVDRLPVDFDEDDYVRAAQQFTQLIRTGNWSGFLETNYRTEHPPLTKILYGVGLLAQPEMPLVTDKPTSASPDQAIPRKLLRQARIVGAVEGTLTVLLLATVNPVGALLLAVHSFTIKYVSQVMLEALPALTSLITILAYVKGRKRKFSTGWLLVSAVFLGLTAASKYIYCLVGIAILVDWSIEAMERRDFRNDIARAVLWGLLAVLVFFTADPYLWPDPLGRLIETVFYHSNYATSASEVSGANFPVWQPFVWLTMSPTVWHENVFVFASDIFITLLAVFGLGRLWNRERVYVIWLGAALLFLLIWPTKWPQYILVLTVPLSLAAAEGVRMAWDAVWDRINRFRREREPVYYNRREVRQSIPWLAPGVLVFFGFTLFPILFQFAISLTDFNSISIRDGLTGGIGREVLGGITGEIEPANPEFPFRSTEVQYIGPSFYGPVFDYVSSNGILFFNILWTVVSVGLQALLGLGAALLLWNKRIPFRRGWQILFILPWAIPEMIGALMWLTIFAPQSGWLALAIQDLGKDIPLAFLGEWQRNPNLTMIILLVAGLWYGFPFMMLAATAGLKQVPTEVFDAAAMDGANAWQTFRHVTFPLLAPLIIPAIIIRGIFAFNQFYLIQLFGFYHVNFSMTTLATLSYNFFNPSGFFGANGQFAVSAAMNIITLLILIGFVTMFNRLSKADEGVTYA